MAFIPIYHFIFYSFIILTMVYSFSILSSDGYVLTVYYVLGTVLSTGVTAVNYTYACSTLTELLVTSP